MSYRIEIVCDVQANPSCASRGGMHHPGRPFGEASTAEGAKIQVKVKAKGLGWTEKRQPGRNPSQLWVCPSCGRAAR